MQPDPLADRRAVIKTEFGFDDNRFGPHRNLGPTSRRGPMDVDDATLEPAAARWDGALGEYVLDWDDVVAASDPHATAVAFARSAVAHACRVCGWDSTLTASAEGAVPPVR